MNDLSDRWMDSVVSRIDFTDDCWEWTGGRLPHGYGQSSIRVDGKPTTRRAHRLVWELVVGPIAEGLQLDHLCRNRACVNPDHLEPVTAQENVARSMLARYGRRGTVCGTHSSYVQGCRCDDCRRADSEYHRARRAELRAKLAAGLVEVVHGSPSTYRNWGCRCDDCRASIAAEARERRLREAS